MHLVMAGNALSPRARHHRPAATPQSPPGSVMSCAPSWGSDCTRALTSTWGPRSLWVTVINNNTIDVRYRSAVYHGQRKGARHRGRMADGLE